MSLRSIPDEPRLCRDPLVHANPATIPPSILSGRPNDFLKGWLEPVVRRLFREVRESHCEFGFCLRYRYFCSVDAELLAEVGYARSSDG